MKWLIYKHLSFCLFCFCLLYPFSSCYNLLYKWNQSCMSVSGRTVKIKLIWDSLLYSMSLKMVLMDNRLDDLLFSSSVFLAFEVMYGQFLWDMSTISHTIQKSTIVKRIGYFWHSAKRLALIVLINRVNHVSGV